MGGECGTGRIDAIYDHAVPTFRFEESSWRVIVRRVAVTTAVVCVVTMILQAWRADAPNLLMWQLVLALTVGVSILTVPWVAWCGRQRVARRRLGALLVLTIAVGGLLGLLVVAAAYVDNTNHPVPWPIATVAMFLPLSLLAPRIAASGRRVAMIAVTNLAVGAFVLDAARRCVDDDCLPLPLPYSLAGVGGLWFIVTELAPFGTFPGDREATSATRRARSSPMRRVTHLADRAGRGDRRTAVRPHRCQFTRVRRDCPHGAHPRPGTRRHIVR